MEASPGKKHNAHWHHTMMWIKDPSETLPFYKQFGFKLLGSYTPKNEGYTVYFMEKIPENNNSPDTNSEEANAYVMNTKTNMLQFCHKHGSESDDQFKINSGNSEPYRGFGHIAFNVDDVVKTSEKLESMGVKFQKRPWEGRMKNIAFILDPNGYWIELVNRNNPSNFTDEYNLSQTMIRVKDAKKSMEFYSKFFNMTLVQQMDMSDFSLYFLMSLPDGTSCPDPKTNEAKSFTKNMWCPALELTHNHGTENDENFCYYTGNDDGFGYLGFTVDNFREFCDEMNSAGYPNMPGKSVMDYENMAYFFDPDGYKVQVVQKGKNFGQFNN